MLFSWLSQFDLDIVGIKYITLEASCKLGCMDKHGRVGWIFSSLRVVSSIVISRGNGNEVIGWFCLVFDLSFRTFGGRVGGDGTLEGDKRCLSSNIKVFDSSWGLGIFFSSTKIEKHTL